MLIGLFIYIWDLVCSNHGFFWGCVVLACLFCPCAIHSPAFFVCGFVVWFPAGVWSWERGPITHAFLACVRIYAGWGIGDPTGVDCLWTRRLAATSRMSAWRSLIPHLVINPSTMAARTSSSLWVLLPNFSPCRWTQRWWWSSSWHDHRLLAVATDR